MVASPTSTAKTCHHQNSDRLDLVLKSKYLRNPEDIDCVKSIWRPHFPDCWVFPLRHAADRYKVNTESRITLSPLESHCRCDSNHARIPNERNIIILPYQSVQIELCLALESLGVSGYSPANALHVLIQVLAGPPVVVRPAGKLSDQLRRGHSFSQICGGHASAERF